MAFSKREKSKKLLAELEYKESQEEIVKELLKIYVHHKIIELDDYEFGKFIEFMNINEEFLKTASDYEKFYYLFHLVCLQHLFWLRKAPKCGK